MSNFADQDILRKLAEEYARIAALPGEEEKRRLWRRLNALKPERPMVIIDQVCWHEMDFDGSLTLRTTDPESRRIEAFFRKKLFQWRHFPADMIFDDFVPVPWAVANSGLGLAVEENVEITEAANDVISHAYLNQFETDADLDKIKIPVVSCDRAESARRLEAALQLFDGILPVRMVGVTPYLSLWDPISTWMGVEPALFAMIDRPEYIHEMIRRMVKGYLAMLDQMEELGVLESPQSAIHCTGAYCDELPRPGVAPEAAATRDLWMFGLAQMLGTVSPEMFEEFEIEPNLPIFERFGLVYYGCCDPLDGRMKQVKRIPHLRKISVSPWAKEAVMAAEIKGDYVYSRKPSPSMLAFPAFDEKAVRSHLRTSIDLCRENGCPLELILKDISTVRHDPERLFRWEKIAMEEVAR